MSKNRQKIGNILNEFLAGSLEQIAKRILEKAQKEETTEPEAHSLIFDALALQVAAGVVRKHRTLLTPKETTP